ncbi:MAG: hypothetical protein ACRDSR_09045 [Pseudonocardiaceae bacterium]
MSVLSVPRIFFKGKCLLNPATGNNNDQWPVYDFTNAELNWDYLNSLRSPITPDNVRQSFPDWARTPRWYDDDPATPAAEGWLQNPGEWNYYGGMEWALHTGTEHTAITGGQLEHGGEVITDDSLVGAVVDVVGDAFPGSTFNTAARFADTNPDSYWNTHFYLKRLQLGTRPAPEFYLAGDVAENSCMTTRWINLQHNLNDDGRLQIAGIGSTVMQACLPSEGLHIADDSSALLRALQRHVVDQRDTVSGVMVRLVIHQTRYFNLPGFECCGEISDQNQRRAAQYKKLTELWDSELKAGLTPSANPAVATAIGTIGLWHTDEQLRSAPGGRYLMPAAPFKHRGKNVRVGPAVLEAHTTPQGNFLSLDLGSTIPEVDTTNAKKDLGPLELALVKPGASTSVPLGVIETEQYAQQRYEATAGIIDVELPAGVSLEEISQGTLELSHAPAPGTKTVLLRERSITVETDDRGLHVNQGERGKITIQVRDRGRIPTTEVTLRVQQYVPSPLPPGINAGAWQLPPTEQHAVIELDQTTVTVPAGTGQVDIEFSALRPGFPIIGFFPMELFPGGPPRNIGPFAPDGSVESTVSASYACARVLPFDDHLPDEFRRHFVASGRDRKAAWDFVYQRILYLHDVMYPVMRYFGALDLGDQDAVDRNIDQILQLSEPERLFSTVYMPVTRELSAGRREVLKIYQQIVHAAEAGLPLEDLEI